MALVAFALAATAFVVAGLAMWVALTSEPHHVRGELLDEMRALRAGQAAFEVEQREKVHRERNRLTPMEVRIAHIEEKLEIEPLAPTTMRGSVPKGE